MLLIQIPNFSPYKPYSRPSELDPDLESSILKDGYGSMDMFSYTWAWICIWIPIQIAYNYVIVADYGFTKVSELKPSCLF